jgi:hypothetical protein
MAAATALAKAHTVGVALARAGRTLPAAHDTTSTQRYSRAALAMRSA